LGDDELASVTGLVDDEGEFSVELRYQGAADDDELSISVVQSKDSIESPATTVAVLHNAPHGIEGTISQIGGDTGGDAVYLRLYTSDGAEVFDDYLLQAEFTVTEGELMAPTSFSLDVPSGTYYLRAFRDVSGPRGADPDGYPTLDSDPQTPAIEVVVTDGDVTGTTVEIRERVNHGAMYHNFEAWTQNESPEPWIPTRYRENIREVGEGQCGGFYLQLQTQREGGSAQLTEPQVQLPDGRVVTLLDDGGCSDEVLNNTAMSYDHGANDGHFSYGIPDPGDAEAGRYTFFFRQTVDDFLHVEVDEIGTVVKLPLGRNIITPLATTITTDRTPEISWEAVTGATAYDVGLYSQRGAYGNDDDENAHRTTSTTYTPATELIDDSCYRLNVVAYDAVEDADAVSHSETHLFCVDSNESQTITVGGTLDNQTDASAPYVIRISSDENRDVTVTLRLPAEATSYSAQLLAGTNPSGGQINAFLDIDGTGYRESLANQFAMADARGLDMTDDLTHNIVFHPAVRLVSPARDAVAASLQPALAWEDYHTTAGEHAPDSFIYALWVQPNTGGGEGMPPTIFAVPSTTTQLDFASLPGATSLVDVVSLSGCMDQDGGSGPGGGQPAEFALDEAGAASCQVGGHDVTVDTSVTTLSASTGYGWGVLVLECAWPDFTDGTQRSTFVECLSGQLGGENHFASSHEGAFSTPAPAP
jgi:hypothetical protein